MSKQRTLMAGLLITAALPVLAQPVQAQQEPLPPIKTFPITTPDAPKPKHTTLRFSVFEQQVADSQSRPLMLKFDFRTLFPTGPIPYQGITLDASLSHLIGTTPAVLSREASQAQTSGYPSLTELAVGGGYRFSFANFGIIPQVHFRDMFAVASGVNQHLIGFEPGLRLEYWLYPEVMKVAVDYGFNVPFVHLANQSSNISPFTLSLNRVQLELSYRVLPMLDVLAGFQYWQAPTQLGTGAINNRVLTGIFGFQVGVGGAF